MSVTLKVIKEPKKEPKKEKVTLKITEMNILIYKIHELSEKEYYTKINGSRTNTVISHVRELLELIEKEPDLMNEQLFKLLYLKLQTKKVKILWASIWKIVSKKEKIPLINYMKRIGELIREYKIIDDDIVKSYENK